MTLEKSLTATPTNGSVDFVLTLRNTGEDTVSLTFRDSGKADFVVLDGDEERWRWSDGRMFAQVLTNQDIEPGDTVDIEAEWEDPDPGEYEVVCELRTMEAEEERTTFSV
ncbi:MULTISPECIES: BsuPI-related putative proteinase inhibitor [unclassified Haladaptatus]|uniref:BsuPI-related putative proteinase inhibitor n=1 Tax=unclassified Haladaptatus TaxID=2622732 RepID=UPI0023E7B988|nr:MULTISPECIES: BsuPI-related putative proteinase inhibitor [unclassified Haladaptatus]